MTYKKILLSLILFFFFISLINSQSITWTKVYGGSYDDIAYTVKQTPDGGYIVIGSSEIFGSYCDNVWILKLNQYGDTVWSKVYDSISGYTAVHDIEVDYDSGYIFTGIKNLGTASDILLIKTDINGDSVWSKYYRLTIYDKPYDICKTHDSCYIIVGSTAVGMENGFILKINRQSDSLWSDIWGEPVIYTSVTQAYDHNYIIGIWSGSPANLSLIKYDSIGNILWSRSYFNGAGIQSVEETYDSSFILACNDYVGNSYIIKTDSLGDTIWTRPYGGWDVIESKDSCYVITGGNGDIYIIKFNANGDSLWSAEYGGSGGDYGRSIEQTSDGGYIIAGVTNSYGAGEDDFYIIKTDSLGYALGVEEWVVNPIPDNFNISYISNHNENILFNFSLPNSDNVKLEIFDLSGRLISIPINDNFPEGEHEINITLPNSGAYIYRFTSLQNEQSGLPAIMAGKFLVF